MATSLLALGVALAIGGVPSLAEAKVFLSRKQAIALAFPEADRVETEVTILDASQTAAIERIARAKLETRIVKLYTGWKGDALLGHAYIDVHTVRTQPEAFLVVLDRAGKVRSLRVLAFHEPLDYLPAERWYAQFEGKSVEQPLRLGRDVHGIMGATLSARAVTSSVRRVMAFYEVLIRSRSARSAGAPSGS